MARSINLLHIAKALNDARAVEWDASKCRTARSSALGIIIVVCGAIALVNFAALLMS